MMLLVALLSLSTVIALLVIGALLKLYFSLGGHL